MSDTYVPCELKRVIISDCDGEHQIVLKESSGQGREVPISIGPFEALAIHAKVHEAVPPRPMTHDLLATLINEMGGTLKEVRVDAFNLNEDGLSGTFHGKLLVKTPEGDKVIDCRPSDGVALSVRLDAPLAVHESVLDSSSS